MLKARKCGKALLARVLAKDTMKTTDEGIPLDGKLPNKSMLLMNGGFVLDIGLLVKVPAWGYRKIEIWTKV